MARRNATLYSSTLQADEINLGATEHLIRSLAWHGNDVVREKPAYGSNAAGQSDFSS
jgi:hypothetical protein